MNEVFICRYFDQEDCDCVGVQIVFTLFGADFSNAIKATLAEILDSPSHMRRPDLSEPQNAWGTTLLPSD
jgi:hypothetical protein